jgi:predicted ferric reductase
VTRSVDLRRPRTAQRGPGSARLTRVRRRRQLQADVLGSIGILIVVATVALWVRGGGIQVMSTPGGVATSTGRLTGLIASALLLIQVLVMSRIPWMEQAWGQDALARKHRWVGFGSFYLMLLHIVLITVGYAQTARTGVLHELWQVVTTYQGMLLATAGTVALVMVVITSMRAARRRLRYESWHLLHLYAYIGVGLALPHQLWTGVDFTASALASVFWWGLWIATAAAVLTFRVGLPLVRSVFHGIRVHSVIQEGPDVVSVVMSGRRLQEIGLQAGQFCQWRFLAGRGWMRAHPFSISAVPQQDRLRITAKFVGDGSRGLAALRPGTRVLFEGPYGVLTADRRFKRDVLMICAGIGITPMRALAEQLAAEGASHDHDRLSFRRPAVTILHRVHSARDLTFAAEFAHLAKRAEVRVVPLVGGRGADSSFFPGPGPVEPGRQLRTLVPGLIHREVYICGPKPFTREVRRVLYDNDIPADHIHAEEFGW